MIVSIISDRKEKVNTLSRQSEKAICARLIIIAKKRKEKEKLFSIKGIISINEVENMNKIVEKTQTI